MERTLVYSYYLHRFHTHDVGKAFRLFSTVFTYSLSSFFFFLHILKFHILSPDHFGLIMTVKVLLFP